MGQPAMKVDMSKLLDFLTGLVSAVLRLLLWLFMAGLGLVLLAVALLLLLLGALWALLRGKRPRVPLAAELLRRQAQQQMRARSRGWGDRGGSAGPGRSDEVVDVEVREVREVAASEGQARPDQRPPDPSPADTSGPDRRPGAD